MPSIRKCHGAVGLLGLLVAALCYNADAKPSRYKIAIVAETPVNPVPKPAECIGLLCMMTPGSMARPITAGEAVRIQAERLQRLESLAAEQANVRKVPRRHVASRVRVIRFARTAARSRVAGGRAMHFFALRAARGAAFRVVRIAGGRPARVAAVHAAREAGARATRSSIIEPVAMFGMTRPTVDQRDYHDWLRRMAWSEGADRPRHANSFCLAGYRDPAVAASLETATIAVDAPGPDLDRRASALSLRGFSALKTAFRGS